MFNSPGDSWDRVRQSFADQFEQDGTSFVYRKSRKGEAIRVSAEERSKFIDEYDRNVRRAKWILYLGLSAALGGVILFSVFRGSDLSELAVFAGIGLVMIPYFAYFRWAWAAPARELAGRTPIAGERSPEEVQRLRFQRISYGQLAGAGLGALAIPFIGSRREDVFSGWSRLWLVFAGGLVLLVAIQAFRKWRFEQEDSYRNVIARSRDWNTTERVDDVASSQIKAQLWRYVPLAVVVLGFAFVGFTPAGKHLARTPNFWSIVLIGCGGWSLFTVVQGFRKGQIEPFVRGVHNTYQRETQPKRFWGSMTWNTILGCLCVWIAFQTGGSISADRCYGQGTNSPQEAVADCTKQIAKRRNPNGDFADLFVARGVAYQQLHDDRHAIADYSEAIRLKPADPNTYYNRALAYQDLGNTRLAISDYSSAIHLQPKFADAFLHRGTAYQGIGDLQEAIADFDEAVRLAPDRPEGYYDRGWARWSLGEEEQAKSDFTVAARFDPTLKSPIRNTD